MFAQLVYQTGASIANVMSDIAVVLTGGALSAASADLNQSSSNLNQEGGVASWVFVSNTNFADSQGLSTLTNISTKLFRQAASTSFGTQNKHLKLGFVTSGTTQVRMGYNIVNGTDVGRPVELPSPYPIVANRASTSATVFNHAIKIQIYSSATATLINVINTSAFSIQPVLAMFDFPLTTPHMELAGNICSVLGNAADFRGCMLPTTIVGKKFGLGGNDPDSSCYARIGTPDYFDMSNKVKTNYTFEKNRRVGTKYPLFNFGVVSFEFMSQETLSQTYYTDNIFSHQIPYSSITDTCGVYMTNLYSFGDSGNFYNTQLGPMCKFGIFMVKV